MSAEATRESATVERLRDNYVAVETKKSYNSRLNQIIKWINQEHRYDLLHSNGTIDLTTFKWNAFSDFILWKYQNSTVTVDTLMGYRSAVKHYYQQNGMKIPEEYFSDAGTLMFRGIRRECASQNQSSGLKDSGKRPLSFSNYYELCVSTLALDDFGFSHLFLILTWNLMCRSKSTQTIHFDHFSIENDAIGVTFFQSKTDQAGSKRKDPKHIYANPKEPTLCVFLALGLYLSCNRTIEPSVLFPGSAQRIRFGKRLCELIENPYDNEEKLNVCIRCGWSLGNVIERYMHYESAGDQFLGRVLSGLPLDSNDFTLLPPHFATANESINFALRNQFPSLYRKASLRGVLKYCLASLVYHRAFLEQVLPIQHPLFYTYVFTAPNVASTLNSCVTIQSTVLKASGLSPNIGLLREIARNRDEIEALPDTMMSRMEQLLDEKGVASSNITKTVLDNALICAVEELKLLSNQGGIVHEGSSMVTTISTCDEEGNHLRFRCWQGQLYRADKHFIVPSIDVMGAWILWWCGSPEKKIPPFSKLSHLDMSRKQKRILNEWRYAMKTIEKIFNKVSASRFPQKPSIDGAEAACRIVLEAIAPMLKSTPTGRVRRGNQLKISSFVVLLRKQKEYLRREFDV